MGEEEEEEERGRGDVCHCTRVLCIHTLTATDKYVPMHKYFNPGDSVRQNACPTNGRMNFRQIDMKYG